ncbi:MAG: transposase, partial [Nocardioidaceae bacterium]
MGKYRKFTPEYRDEAVKMVLESDQPIARVARELGINEGTLGNWINWYRREHPVSEELNLPERARLRELERENRELRTAGEGRHEQPGQQRRRTKCCADHSGGQGGPFGGDVTGRQLTDRWLHQQARQAR